MSQTQSVRAAWYEDDGGFPSARIGNEFRLYDGDHLTAPNIGERVWLLTLADGLLNSHPIGAGAAMVWEVRDHQILSPGRPVWVVYNPMQGL